MTSPTQQGRRSRLVHAGRPVGPGPRPVNVPISRATTIVQDSVEDMKAADHDRSLGKRVLSYGRRGTTTTFALEDALVELEHGYGARLLSSGLAANALVFLSFATPGDHVFLNRSVYLPVKRFADLFLRRYGIELTYFDGHDFEELVRPNTKLVYLENPGSGTFPVFDLPKIVCAAHAHDLTVAVDNTWASGWLHNPLTLGADVSIIAATKYLVGHSDVHLGAVIANEKAWPAVNLMADLLGASVSPEDAYLVLRGLRTLAVRLREHERQATALAEFARELPFVQNVYYPPLPDHEERDVWARDFRGACGLFSIELKTKDESKQREFVNALRLFSLGASWGGFESLVRLENHPEDNSKHLIRLHAGFEDLDDLKEDILQAAQVLQ